YKLGNNTMAGTLFYTVLLNTFVIYLIYRLALNFMTPKYALFTAIFYAVAPWPVYYSFGFWNPIPMAFFGSLLFLSLWQVTKVDNSSSIFWVCLIAAIIPQFHMISLFYYPAILLILYLSPTRINTTWLSLGIIAGIAVYLPYILGEINNNWENTRAVLSGGSPSSFGVFKIITAPLGVLSSQSGRWTGDDITNLYRYGDLYFGSFIIMLIFFVVSIVNSVFFMRKIFWDYVCALGKFYLPTKQAYKNSPEIMFIGIILFVPPLLFLLTRHNYGSRYVIIIFPLIFLLPAMYMQALKYGKKKKFFISNIAIICTFNVYLLFSFFHYQAGQIDSGNYFIPSFINMDIVYNKLKSDAGKDGHISIDAALYKSKHPATDEYYAGSALTRYISLKQKAEMHSSEVKQTQVYRIVDINDVQKSDKLVYTSNNMALIRL
ncbi:MAG: hypothetical protein ACC707_19755, partial [Thiohalomonadales bacterium]